MNIAFLKEHKKYNIINIIKDLHRKYKIDIKIMIYKSVKEMLIHAARLQLDIAIIGEEIEGEEIDGYDVAYHLKMINYHTLPIMLGNKKELSIKAGSAELFGYIAPEQVDKKLLELIDYAIRRFPRYRQKILCYRWNGINKEIKLEDIIYFSSEHKVINIKAIDGGKRKFYQKLDVVEETLRQQGIDMLRINKSFLINPKYIKETNKKEITLYDGEKVSVSPKYQSIGN